MAHSKELIQKSIQNLKHHLKENHSNLPNLKIFENIGGYPFVIKFTSFNDYDLNLTLQITSDYNLSNSIVVISQLKSKKISEKTLNSFEDLLNQKIKDTDSQSEKFLVKFFEKAFDFAEKNFEKYQNNIDNSPKNKKKETKNSKSKSDDEQEGKSTKKASMKTANDVVNRIQWDEEVNKDFIIVGYEDRFLGLKECMFNTFDWGDIVLADYGALAVPEHRITYFKYKNEIIWDKKNRLDNIFGSTGSGITIRDVIKRLENTDYKPLSIDSEPIHKMGRHGQESDEKNTNPNYFLSIPIENFRIKMNMDEISADLMKFNEDVESFLVPDTSMHLTLCTLRIEDNEETELVKKVMNDLKTDEEFIENSSINLNFKGIGEFYKKVLYVKCEGDDLEKLQNLKRILLDSLKKSNINTAGNYYDFVPHLTIFKIKNNSNNGHMTVDDFVSSDLWNEYKNYEFGQDSVHQIQLCKMVDIFVSKSYPIVHMINI